VHDLTSVASLFVQASNFEGGIRTPGIMHAPMLIKEHRNVTTVAVTSDFLPTIMELLDVKSDNPTWYMRSASACIAIWHCSTKTVSQ
jgi:arylsulfatase A-like enzyme